VPTVVGSLRAPAAHHMTVADGEDLLDVKVKIGKRRDVELEELPSPFIPENSAGKASDFHVVFVSNRLTRPSTS
jgi:hypothetical protein